MTKNSPTLSRANVAGAISSFYGVVADATAVDKLAALVYPDVQQASSREVDLIRLALNERFDTAMPTKIWNQVATTPRAPEPRAVAPFGVPRRPAEDTLADLATAGDCARERARYGRGNVATRPTIIFDGFSIFPDGAEAPWLIRLIS